MEPFNTLANRIEHDAGATLTVPGDQAATVLQLQVGHGVWSTSGAATPRCQVLIVGVLHHTARWRWRRR